VLCQAGESGRVSVLRWLREQGATWPESFLNAQDSSCWSIAAIQWALANGSTWLQWRCQDLAPQEYYCAIDGELTGAAHNDSECKQELCDKRKAAQLFAWAHEHGCPCTCVTTAASVSNDTDAAVIEQA
jgi:hypothetical protein